MNAEEFAGFQNLYYLIRAIQPFLIPLCFVCAWLFSFLVAWSIFSSIRETLARAKQMHEIPCSECKFFTNNHRLKCTVRPTIANTEEAIDCSDYRPN